MTDKIVVLDSAIHSALRQVAQNIADEHGVAILKVQMYWRKDPKTQTKYVLDAIEVRTRSG